MAFLRSLIYGIRNLLRRTKRERDIADEIERYFEEAAAAQVEHGMTAEEARRTIRMEAGTMSSARAQANSYGWENSVSSFFSDLRFAARQLARHRAFTVTATLTLALGIGANAAIFTAIDSILLAPLPFNHADRLAVLGTRYSNTGRTTRRVTGPDGVDVRDQAKSLEAVSLMAGGEEGVQLRDHATYTEVTWVDENFPRVYSLQPIAGRLFSDAESHRSALVNEQFARNNFGSAQAALGQTVHIENEAIEIVGVLPGSFHEPGKTEVWEAFSLLPESKSRTAFNYRAVALLRESTSFQTAQTELNSLSQRLQTAYPEDNRNKQMVALPMTEALTGSARPTLMLLWGAVGIILLIACVNVTHLQLVRSMTRQREIAIRKALGSSRWQVMRPVLLESLLLAILGCAAGLLLALPAVRILIAMAPKELPRAGEIHLNGWVLAFTMAISVLTALVSSILPAMRAAKVAAADAMKQDASRGMERKGAARLRDGLVIAEIAATFVLAVAAALLLRTMSTLMTSDLGFETQRMLVVDADNPAHTDDDYRRMLRQFDEIFANLAAIPGVEHVAGVMGLPMGPYGSNGNYNTRGGLPVESHHAPEAIFSVASPEYFQTMGIPMLRGRDFNAQDAYDNPFVVVISQSVAKQSFGNIDPIGKQIQCGLDSDKWMTIVGVVGDIRQNSPAENPGPALYMPMKQHPAYANQIHIVLRTHVKPLTLINTVHSEIARANPLIAMRFTTMDSIVNESITAQRFRAALISLFAAAGLLLSMLGVYGTMAYTVAQRTFEIGIRMAFGANRAVILRAILRHAAILAGIGIAAGLVLSLLLARLVSAMLVGVQPMDPASLGGASLLLLLTAIAAASAPGWKATHINPLAALRAE
ncbi:ABC transporter permease [Terracidiphilus gabretensis]|uniref:ABC transporter permease n=1 Tax=Terracidiphilus gabretensis TaxID=1577687 RepID=UPI00071BCE74|nr:ABC transporter permease [Terracidiphilus gabretensis]